MFSLEHGSQAGQYVPSKLNELYALTVKKVDHDKWRLNYGVYHIDNTLDYEWCFRYHNGAFAIRWCGSDVPGKDFVLHLDNDELVLSNQLLPEHYTSNFHST